MSFSLSGNKRSDEKMYFAAVIQVRKKKKEKKGVFSMVINKVTRNGR